ncbi:MFS transporter [Paenibacillus andongensis]|uniref:MFS transporter n=1 Tax=Paenibacillus andongensis TaxID=2975482 RepID=UPI0021BA9837|nr:MFS transporter [Paenibacillus andongensis]
MNITRNESGNNISSRLDRLPITSIHRKVIAALAIVYFFEFADLNTFSYVAPALKKHWGMSVSTIGLVTSCSFLGMFLGSAFGGWVADRFGRRNAIIANTVFFSILSLLTAFAWDPVSLGVLRFLTGMGASAALINANTYVSEFFPSASRGKYQGMTIAVGLLGIPLTAWVSSYLVTLGPDGWRYVFAWGALGLFSIYFLRKLVEIPRWHFARGDFKKAEAIMQKIEETVLLEKGELPPITDVLLRPRTQLKAGSLIEIFKGKYLGRTSILTLTWVFQTIGFYGFSSWVPTLLVQHGIELNKSLIYSSLITVGAPLGALVGAFISDRFERKWNLAVSSIIIAICVLLYGMTFNPLFLISFGFLVNLMERVYSSNLYAYTSELYPTEIRATGYGFTYGIGRVSNVLGPIIISYFIINFGNMSVFSLIAATWIGSAIALSFGPKTNKRNLDEINSEEPKIVGRESIPMK